MVHGWVTDMGGEGEGLDGPAQEGRDPGIACEAGKAGKVGSTVTALDRNAFGCEPRRSRRRARRRRIGKFDVRKIGNLAHRVTFILEYRRRPAVSPGHRNLRKRKFAPPPSARVLPSRRGVR